MAFNPLPSESVNVAPRTLDTDAVLCTVRAAAETLVADLDHARELTGDWGDQPLTDALVEAAVCDCLARLQPIGLDGEPNRLPSSELWRIAGPLLKCGWLQNRCREKPRGYAGDYELLDRICHGRLCEHPLGRAFDRYFQNQAAPQAARSRAAQAAAAVASHLLNRPISSRDESPAPGAASPPPQGSRERRDYHLLSVGAGPGTDVRKVAELLPDSQRDRLRISLMDVDPDALAFARSCLSKLVSTERISTLRANVFRLPERPALAADLGEPDAIVCLGLFDYLEPPRAVAMLRLFWERLVSGGLLLVGNFAPHNPTRTYMEWFGNWYLTYRTADEIRGLAKSAGIPADRHTVACERLGVQLFLVGNKL